MNIKKTLLIAIILGVTLFSCQKNTQKKLHLVANIKGLKKGTVFIQALKDSIWIDLDSVNTLQKDEILFEHKLAYPQILKLSIDHKKEYSFTFFAENKPMKLEALLEKMEWKNKIFGSKNDSILRLYKTQTKELRFRRLKLMKEKIAALKTKDNQKLDALNQKELRMLRNEYLFGINFVAKERNYEVAPYIATTFLKDVNNNFLNKILDTLPTKIKNSHYGVALQKMVKSRSPQ